MIIIHYVYIDSTPDKRLDRIKNIIQSGIVITDEHCYVEPLEGMDQKPLSL